jgi:hypothetical protein
LSITHYAFTTTENNASVLLCRAQGLLVLPGPLYILLVNFQTIGVSESAFVWPRGINTAPAVSPTARATARAPVV